jgi:hypothetical protein
MATILANGPRLAFGPASKMWTARLSQLTAEQRRLTARLSQPRALAAPTVAGVREPFVSPFAVA